MPVPSGYSGTPLVQKLGIKPGFRIFVAGAPADYAGITGKLPDGVTIAQRLVGAIDMVHLFAADAKELDDKLRRYRQQSSRTAWSGCRGRRSPPAFRPICPK